MSFKTKIRIHASLCALNILIQYVILFTTNSIFTSREIGKNICNVEYFSVTPYVAFNFSGICKNSNLVELVENYYNYSIFFHVLFIFLQFVNSGFSKKLFVKYVNGWPLGPILLSVLFLIFSGWLFGDILEYPVNNNFDFKFFFTPLFICIFISLFMFYYSKIHENFGKL